MTMDCPTCKGTGKVKTFYPLPKDFDSMDLPPALIRDYEERATPKEKDCPNCNKVSLEDR